MEFPYNSNERAQNFRKQGEVMLLFWIKEAP